MKTTALYNIKGGVGKTAAAVNLAYLAAQDGFRTLLIDLDPQSAASFYFRIRPAKKQNSRKIIKGGSKTEKFIKGTDYDFLDLLPADFSYRNLDLLLDSAKKSRRRLKDIIKPFSASYDLVFLDCPPNITLVSENAFYASDVVLMPVIPTILSIRTADKLLDFFKNNDLPANKISGFFSMVEKRKRMHQHIITETREVSDYFLIQTIPYLSDIEKMGVYREPVPCFRPKSVAATAFERLWKEFKTTSLKI